MPGQGVQGCTLKARRIVAYPSHTLCQLQMVLEATSQPFIWPQHTDELFSAL